MTTDRVNVSLDDLYFAAEWLESYDGAEDDENNAASLRVANWLRNEINRREIATHRRAIRSAARARMRAL